MTLSKLIKISIFVLYFAKWNWSKKRFKILFNDILKSLTLSHDIAEILLKVALNTINHKPLTYSKMSDIANYSTWASISKYYWLSFYMINQFLIKVHNIFSGINFVYASLYYTPHCDTLIHVLVESSMLKYRSGGLYHIASLVFFACCSADILQNTYIVSYFVI